MKRCSVSYATRKLQIKNNEIPRNPNCNSQNPKHWHQHGVPGTGFTADENEEWLLWKTGNFIDSLAVYYKVNIVVTYKPAITIPEIYLNELKSYVHVKTCTQMFTAILLITAKISKQLRCP